MEKTLCSFGFPGAHHQLSLRALQESLFEGKDSKTQISEIESSLYSLSFFFFKLTFS